MAAINLSNRSWNHEPVIIFALTSDGSKGFLRISRIQGEETLQQLLNKEGKSTELFTHHSVPLPPPRNSANQNTKFTINASVKKEIDLRREIYVLHVGISST
jgi:hypothetical protein